MPRAIVMNSFNYFPVEVILVSVKELKSISLNAGVYLKPSDLSEVKETSQR